MARLKSQILRVGNGENLEKKMKNISRNIYFGGVVAATTLSTKRDPEQWQQQHDLDFVCL